MIHPDSRTIDWIESVANEHKIKDIALVEKTIRAFSLLEALSRSGCPFIFKGGTSLMLHLGSAKRLSIDIDIICPPGTHIEDYLQKYSQEYGFGEVRLIERISRTKVPKQHAKFYYQVAYYGGSYEDKILLDVLFEDTHYQRIVRMPIEGPFIKTEGEPVMVNLPSHEDLLGDKLTAFAPNTTGIPYYKGEKNCSMEINKQLFDIASLFDITNNIATTAVTFQKLAQIELQYRQLESNNLQQVIDDIFQTSLCISTRGAVDPDKYKMLQEGILRVRSFIHSEKYSIESAITNASKTAYLCKLIEQGITEVKHFAPESINDLATKTLTTKSMTKLNKLKKTNIEAFFYWNEVEKLMG